MAIYTASYFEPQHHHGKLLAVSCSLPKGFKVSGKIKFLTPAANLLTLWKQGLVDQAKYIQCYRAQIAAGWKQVDHWLISLNPQEDATLLCWEKQGEFCHRNLIGKLIQKHRPNCWGGADVLRVERLICPICTTKVYPGLGFSFCPYCCTWLKSHQLCSKG